MSTSRQRLNARKHAARYVEEYEDVERLFAGGEAQHLTRLSLIEHDEIAARQPGYGMAFEQDCRVHVDDVRWRRRGALLWPGGQADANQYYASSRYPRQEEALHGAAILAHSRLRPVLGLRLAVFKK